MIVAPRRRGGLAMPLLVTALACGLTLAAWAGSALAQTQSMSDEQSAFARAAKQRQQQLLMSGPMRRLAANRKYVESVRRAQKKHQPIPARGAALKRPVPGLDDTPMLPGALPRYSIEQALTAPTNVRANNPATDVAAGSGQSENFLASWGSYVLAAWNDGEGFSVGPDTQGYGYSLDGGATFTDGGMVPKSTASGTWTSDPVVMVNEKTGEFWYCGLYDSSASLSGVAVVKATLSPGGITWGKVRIVDMLNNTSFFIDKQWMAVDSLTGNLYVTYTKFTAFDDTIMFVRSTDGGSTWSKPMAVSNPATAGYQQGSRVVVGPSGEVYLTWSEIGPVDADYFMVRKSTDFGVSFTPEVIANSHYANFGTGAPAFNRERSVDFPSIYVDRTNGAHRGRVYLAWHESLNWYNNLGSLGTLGNKNEVEVNNTYLAATPFTPGQRLRGAFSSTSDTDWFSFAATQGQSYIFVVDSIPRPLYYVYVYCSDGTTRLSLGGEFYSPGGASYIVFTAPATATYYLRMRYYGNLTGGYRIQTGTDAPVAEPGRDQRDVVMTWSDNGTTWATSKRVNDEAAYYDDFLPEVTVGADGEPYVVWYDWRSTTCGGSSHVYASRSSDGGANWATSQVVTTAATPWSTVSSNIAPNMGDYIGVYGDDRYVRPVWSDGRGGTPDTYTGAIDTRFTLSGCLPDTTVHPTDVLNLTPSVTNLNPLFGNDYTVQVTTNRNWPSTPAPLAVASLTSNSTAVSLVVPDTAAAGTLQACVKVTNASGSWSTQCCFAVTVLPNASVEPGGARFALGQNTPNPMRGSSTSISFSLPRAGDVRLEVFRLDGGRVRTLVNGARSAGPQSVIWDGRDDHGHAVKAGTYFYRLNGFGQSAVKRLIVLP